MAPFTNLSWVCIVTFLIVVPIFLKTTGKFDVETINTSMRELYGIVCMTLIGLGPNYNPSTLSNRLAFGR